MPPTKSSWASEALAVFHKEWLTEMRSRHGLFTTFLFSLLAVVAMAFASFGLVPVPSLAAGMLCVTLLFSSVIALPRTFLAEDEQGTFDLLRLSAEPTALYFGKYLYNVAQSVISAAVLALLFTGMTSSRVEQPVMFTLGVLFTALALAGGVSVCGALVMGAANRWILSAAVSLPILLPQVFLAVEALRVAMGEGTADHGWSAVFGLFGWALVLASSGPYLAALAWKTDE